MSARPREWTLNEQEGWHPDAIDEILKGNDHAGVAGEDRSKGTEDGAAELMPRAPRLCLEQAMRLQNTH